MKCSSYGIAVILSSVFFISVRAITPHNVDVQEPFIATSPATDDSNDGFGWSAIFHRIDTSTGGTLQEVLNRTKIIVGAPRGTFPRDLDVLLPAVNRSGLVYNCPIGTSGPCSGVRGDISEYIGPNLENITNELGAVQTIPDLFPQAYSEGRLFDQAPNARFAITQRIGPTPEQAEIKADQLMGSYLFSSGDQIIACASSWVYYSITGIIATKSPSSNGICYVGGRNLEGFITTSPCLVDSAPDAENCLAGISAPIADGRVYIGALGYDSLKGTIYDRSASTTVTSTSFDRRSPTLNSDTYFGFEVATGYFTNSRTSNAMQDVIVGAIRYQNPSNTGAVFHRGTDLRLVTGQQIGENFGYAIALVDLNGDGFDELIVGAPTYSSLESNDFLIERGRIFIYLNHGTGDLMTTFNESDPMIIAGNFSRMRLGLRIANAGDLNSDDIPDMIVAAPYEPSNTTNSTGAIYVYYGNSDMEAFRNQEPQKIHADDIVEAVTDVTVLRSFGFSISGLVDVDNNAHTDIVVGGYEDQVVTMLRTRPFANVQVSFESVPDVNLDTQSVFNVTVIANYSSKDPGLTGARQFMYQLQEIGGSPRLSFESGSTVFTGTLNFDSQQRTTQTVIAHVDDTVDPTRPYQLMLSLMDVDKNATSLSKTGKLVESLASFPRFRLFGDNTLTVNISDLCGGDDCQSDIRVSSNPTNISIVAGAKMSAVFIVSYANSGPEEARNLQLVITGIPTSVFGIPQVSTGIDNTRVDCAESVIGGFRNVTCTLQQRLRNSDSRNASISLPITNAIGNEPSFTIEAEVLVDTTGNNNDTNPNNNVVNITFSLESESDISVQTRFPEARLEYMTVAPMTLSPTTSELGQQGRLTVSVSNAGPSTIQNARVTIYFPARNPQITKDNYFLYPVALNPSLGMSSITAGTVVACDMQNIDPQCLDKDPNNTNCRSISNRQKRSGAMTMETKRRRRAVVAEMARLPRQATSSSALNCSTSPQECLKFVCNITKLIKESVDLDLLLDFSIDERFFTTQTNMEYNLTAVAMVEVLDEFQRIGDNKTNDRSSATVRLVPPPPQEGGGPELYLAIILPAVFGLLIVIIIGILLYCFGFFRRKKKPGEDDELEPIPSKQPPPPKETNENDKEKEEVITKV